MLSEEPKRTMLETYGEYFLELVQRIKGKEYCVGQVCLLPDVAAYFLSDYFRFWVICGGSYASHSGVTTIWKRASQSCHSYPPHRDFQLRSSLTSTLSIYVSSPMPTTPASEAFSSCNVFSHGTFTHADLAVDSKMLEAVAAILYKAELRRQNSFEASVDDTAVAPDAVCGTGGPSL